MWILLPSGIESDVSAQNLRSFGLENKSCRRPCHSFWAYLDFGMASCSQHFDGVGKQALFS